MGDVWWMSRSFLFIIFAVVVVLIALGILFSDGISFNRMQESLGCYVQGLFGKACGP